MALGLGAPGANTALDALAAGYRWVKLHVGDPGANGTANPATETTRKQATFSASAAGATSNTGLLTWSNVAANEDYTHFTLWSTEPGGNFGGSGTVTANPVSATDSFQVGIGDLDLSFTVAS
jgi:hypothetical protein